MRRIALLLTLIVFTGCANNHVLRDNPIVGLPEVVPTTAKGGYVAVAFSRAANKVYLGRSTTSTVDALNVAVAGCINSDCRQFSITNHNGCLAFAANVDKERRWGNAGRLSADDSMTVAVKSCNSALLVDNCVPVVTLCPEY